VLPARLRAVWLFPNRLRYGFILLASFLWGSDFINAGDAYALSARAEGANACYNVAMLEDPRLSLQMDFLLRKSRIGRELGDEELARAILLRAQNLAVSGSEIGRTCFLLGLDAFFVKDYASARESFSRALIYHPDPPLDILYYLGWSLYKEKHYEGTRNVFLNLKDLNQGEFPAEEINTLLAATDFNTASPALVKDRLQNAAAYPAGTWYREEALYLAGYSAFSIDSVSEAREFFSQLEDSTRRIYSLACVALQEGDFSQAASLYARLDNEASRYGHAVSLYLAGDLRGSERSGQGYLDDSPQGVFAAPTYFLLGIIERDRGRLRSAAGMIETGIELDSEYRPVLFRALAETHFARKRYRDALEVFSELFTRYPEGAADETARLLVARSLFYIGQTDSAEVSLNALLDATDDEVIVNEARYYLGEIAARRGDYLLAAEEFAAVNQGSLSQRALKRKAEVLAKAGRHKQAVEAFRQALALTTSVAAREDIMLAIEESRLALGVYPDRITMLKKYIERHPDATHNPELQLQVALEYVEAGNCIAAMHEVNKLLSRYPDSKAAPEALEYKARCQRRLGKIEDAIATYRDIPKLSPASVVLLRSQAELAELLLSLGRDAEALSVYRELSETSRDAADRASFILAMARIYYSQGNYQTAVDLIGVAVGESSGSSVLKKAFLLGIDVKLAQGDIPAAGSYAKRYLNRFGETADYLFHRAAIYRTSGKLGAAFSAYKKAAARFPASSELRIDALIGAADAARLLGQISQARDLLQEAALEVRIDRQRIEITRRLQTLE